MSSAIGTRGSPSNMMTSAKSVSVNAAELRDAFEFVSAGLLYEHAPLSVLTQEEYT